MKAMRYLFVIILSFVLTSCEFEIDFGFKNITFTSSGGEKTITGNKSFVFAEIQDYKGNHGSIEGGEDRPIQYHQNRLSPSVSSLARYW